MESISTYLRKIAEKASGRSITFLGTGPSEPIVERSGKSNRKSTTTLIEYKGKSYLIDTPPDLDPKTNFDYLLFTHMHFDAFDGFDKVKGRKFTLGLPSNIDKKFEKEEKKGPWEKKTLKIDREKEFGDLTVTPFDITHDIVYKFPTVGYRIVFKDGFVLVYVTDILKIPQKSEQFFEKIDLLIIGGTGWNADLSTHIGIWTFLDLVKEKKWNIKKIYFTHIGRPVPDYQEAQKQLLIRYPNIPFHLAYDGLKIKF